MNFPLNRLQLILVICLLLFTCSSYAQECKNGLTLTKLSKADKTKSVDTNAYFKVKTIDGKKIKGKFAKVHNNYFVSTTKDTIYINTINWIRVKKQLTKWEKALSIVGVFGGTIYSYGSTMAALMIIAMEANYWIILAPALIIPATFIAYRTLLGRRYKLRKWQLQAQTILN